MGLGRLDIHAGDFERGKTSQFTQGKFLMKTQGKFVREDISIGQVQEIEVASEESVKKFGGSLVGGALGAAAFGTVGLLAGAMAGGTGKDVTFLCTFTDGRKMMATTDSKTYADISAELFDFKNGSGKHRAVLVQDGAAGSPLKKARWIAVAIWLFGGAMMTNAMSATAPESGKQGAIVLWTVIVVLGWFAWKKKRGLSL